MDGTAKANTIDFSGPRVSDAPPVAETLRAFWRHKFLMLTIVVLVTGLAAITAYQLPPRYTATARILINPEATADSAAGGASAARALLSGGAGGRVSIYSEIEVMRSDRLLEKVITTLNLADDIEFNPALQPGMFASLRDFAPVKWLIGTLSPLSADLSEKERRQRETKRIVDSVRGRMVIRPPGLANVVAIQFETNNAAKSALLANRFVDIYSDDRLSRAAKGAAGTRLWLDSRIAELEAQLRESERKVAEFLASRRLDDNGASPTIDRRVIELGRRLGAAQSELAEKRVRLRQLRRIEASGTGIGSTTEVQNSRAIQRLTAQEDTLVRRAAELDTRFGAKHPTMINLRAEIENTRNQIKAEHKRIIAALANEVRVAEAAVRSIRDQMQTVDIERAATNEDRVQFLQMKREALTNRKLYEVFVTRSKEAEQVSSLMDDPVEMIAQAKAPTHPSAPRKPLIVSFGFFVSVGLALGLVLVVERLDGGFRSVTQVERILREPTLGLVPRIRGSERRRNNVHDIVFTDAHSGYVEAIRSLRTSLLVASADAPPKVVLIASSEPGDGKTSLAISLARLSALASTEGRVLLIDGDLRKPSVSPRMGMNPDKGLMHLFSGEASLDEVILTDDKSGLHVLPANIGTQNPPELLNSTHMRDLLAKLRTSYEMIIIDSPALDAVSDARVLAHYADTTIFVVRWESTKQHAAFEAMKQLTTAGARIAGVVLQQVNVRKTGSYGYRETVG
tara:strand:- start:21826 stop:24042 length:2217 start_codon:yes stop_codon:yes gene_type:complete